ncbi:MAG TPA: chemotaxis protein CheW [Acidobacteriaceae bacterium]|jgi:purine-binding chemotaxis protein CheW
MNAARKHVDWSETRQRLATIQERIDQLWTPSAEERAMTLEARARLLAREPEAAKDEAAQLDVVEFLLAYERYGIATSFVHEVYPLVDLTPLPGAPSFVLGVANVRGRIVSVMDIKRFFDLPAKGLTNLNKLIIVRKGDLEIGILADELLGVRSVGLASLEPPLPTMTGIRAEYLRGIDSERLAILDIENILADQRIIVEKTTGEWRVTA